MRQTDTKLLISYSFFFHISVFLLFHIGVFKIRLIYIRAALTVNCFGNDLSYFEKRYTVMVIILSACASLIILEISDFHGASYESHEVRNHLISALKNISMVDL
jgi:hypothetical protein